MKILKDYVDGKLDLNWEGQYKIMKLTGKWTYNLEDLNGKQYLRPWNNYFSFKSSYFTEKAATIVTIIQKYKFNLNLKIILLKLKQIKFGHFTLDFNEVQCLQQQEK